MNQALCASGRPAGRRAFPVTESRKVVYPSWGDPAPAEGPGVADGILHCGAPRCCSKRRKQTATSARMDRNELGAILVAAGLGAALEHALISLLALNGLRVSEATSADIEEMGTERGHRTLPITRKGNKLVPIPLAPRPPERWASPSANEQRTAVRPLTAGGWTGTAPPGSSAGSPAAPGSATRRPPRCGTRSSPQRSSRRPVAGRARSRLPRRPRTTIRYDRARATWTGTPPTSSPPSSPEQHADSGDLAAHRPAGLVRAGRGGQ